MPEGITDTGTPPPDNSTAWYSGADAELVGHLQNRGWDKLEPAAAALEASKAYREMEKFRGIPGDQILRVPPDQNDAEGWSKVWEKLGAPKDATGYDLSSVKRADGTDLDPAFADFARKTAAELHLPKDAASRLASEIVKYNATQDKTAADERAALLATQADSLKTNWGANYNANLEVAKQAAARLGLSPEFVNAAEKELGYDKIMDNLRKIGAAIGEDKFVSNLNPALPGVKTREQAVSEKAELMHDQQWVSRYMAGGATEARQMLALNKLIVEGRDG